MGDRCKLTIICTMNVEILALLVRRSCISLVCFTKEYKANAILFSHNHSIEQIYEKI